MKVGVIPAKIADAPTLRFGLELYYAGFFDLIGCRSGSFGDGPIMFSAIMDYARAAEFSPEQADDLVFYVGQLDGVYMEHVRKKQPKGAGAKAPITKAPAVKAKK